MKEDASHASLVNLFCLGHLIPASLAISLENIDTLTEILTTAIWLKKSARSALQIAWFAWTLRDAQSAQPPILLIELRLCPQKSAFPLVTALQTIISRRLGPAMFVMSTALSAIAEGHAKLVRQDIS